MLNNLNSHKDLPYMIKKTIADHLGVDLQDVNEEDAFFNDLHMNPTELYDLIETFSKDGYDIVPEEVANCETVSDLIDLIATKEDIK